MMKTRQIIEKISLAVTAMICSAGISTHYAHAADAAVICKSLAAEQSDDKNYYKFTAKATASNDAKIMGYEFNFGDHQTYIVNFNDTSKNDSSVAVAKHTYEKPGNYTTKASVVSSKDNKTTRVSSPDCIANIAIGQPAVTMLPTTGPNDSLTLIVSIILGVYTYIIVRILKGSIRI
jgi:hypothetical protein